jgi:SAM-dependent methyltransferase
MERRLASWLLRCPDCGLWRSELGREDRLQESEALDESRRVSGLATLREENYRRTLAALRHLGPLAGRRLLDVGCAYGWFLRAAGEAGMEPFGLEPDPAIATLATAAARDGHPVWVGYFPAAVPAGETFDVIAFNDVLEHLHDLDSALAACRRLLRPGGLLVIAAPDSRGFLFRLACPLARLGARGLLDRLWQKGYPSPHLSYFHHGNLRRLMRRHGFVPRREEPLQSLTIQGLWARLHMDRRPSLRSTLSFAALAASLPALLWLLPSDQLLGIYATDVAARSTASADARGEPSGCAGATGS